MIRIHRKWTSLLLIMSMLLVLLPPFSAYAAAPRIIITSLYTDTNSTTNLPQNDDFVTRYTTSPISISATIENIADSEVSTIYYEVTNVTTNVSTVEKSNPPVHTPGTYDITFNNVALSDGLNKIVIKMGDTSVVASAPGWAYFTPTTNISNLTINDIPYSASQMYPDNPALGTMVSIKGEAPNATQVQASILGNSTVRNAYLNNGSFLLTGDDMSKTSSTANFLLRPGDNLFTLLASNNSKSFTLQKNIIYDNGNPFAFNAKIRELKSDLTPLDPLASPAPLITNPTVTTPNVQVTSTLKDDLDSLGNLKYRYVDVLVGGKRFGPYDLGGATAATSVAAISPTTFTEGYSDTLVSLVGTALTTTNVKLQVEDKDGTVYVAGVPSQVNSNNTVALVNLAAGKLLQAKAPYTFKVLDASTSAILYQTVVNVNQLTPAPPVVDTATFTPPAGLKQGYAGNPYTIPFTTDISSLVAGKFRVDFVDLTGQTIYATGTGSGFTPSTGTANTLNYNMPTGLNQGDYKMRVSYNGTLLTEQFINIAAPNPISPAVTQPVTPFIAGAIKALSPTKSPTYFTVGGTDFGTDPSKITAATLTPTLTATAAGGAGGTLTLSTASTAPAGTVIKYIAGTSKALLPAVLSSGTTYSAPLTFASLGANTHVSAAAIYPNGTTSYFDFIINAGTGTITTAPTASISVSATLAESNRITFKVDDQSDLDAGMLYDLTFTHATNSTALTAKAVLLAKDPATFTSYSNEAVKDVSPLQMMPSEIATTSVTINGQNLSTASNLLVEVLTEDGTALPYNATVNGAGGATASVTLPNLTVGNYLLRLSYNNNVLATYPLAIVNPVMTDITPKTLPDTIVASGTETMTITGTAFGRDESALKVRFQRDDDASAPTFDQAVNPGTLSGGASFDTTIPVLPLGTYSVSLLYNGTVMGTPMKFTVTSAPVTLAENSQWSRAGRYKAFDFAANLAIPSDRYQVVQFKFYNFITDNVPPTSFTYSYIDPSLPYVDHINRGVNGSQMLLPEGTTSEVNELPSTFYIYTNSNTTKVNVYVGDYDNNTPIYKTIRASVPADGVLTNQVDPVSGGTTTYNVFPVTLKGISNGVTKITVVPAKEAVAPALPEADKANENIGGRKQYDLAVSNTPYVIVNNIYNGLTVKDQISEISCNNSGTPVGRCIYGRIVNVDLNALVNTPSQNYVEIELNGNPTKLLSTEFDSNTGTFQHQFTTSLGEGKNTIKVRVFQNGEKVTESSYDVFVFSTSAPEIVKFQPVETSDTIKFTPGSTIDTYATSETSVSLTGQFVNATDIKLTVRQKDQNGNPIVKYDRRYGSSRDPISGNPNYFNSVDFLQGQFVTNAIPLSQKGDTIFELTITNSSNVTVMKTITITREPLPYVIVYPTLAKNAKGDWQANINSNYIEIEMIAEDADSVVFGKDQAVTRQVVDSSGNLTNHYFYEVSSLKAGMNTIKFTVNRGTQSTKGQFILFNADTPVEGAQYKTPLTNKMKVFDDNLELSFPKGTNLMRNDPSAVDQYLTADRKILFGIASSDDGRVDKFKHPSATDGQVGNPNPLIGTEGKLLLTEPTGRFRPASKLYWIDAGTIMNGEPDRTKALTGSGRLPYDNPDPFYSRNEKDLVVPTDRGTLTLKYDPNIRQDSWKYITVYHFDIYEDYKGAIQPRWRNIGGVINPSNNTVTVPFDTFGYYQVMYMDQSFDDVTDHPWARDDLDALYARGLMLNKTDTSFVPNDPISRGEFATLLVKIFDIKLDYDETPTFTDVLRYNPATNGLYDYKYIETAARAGIIRGSGGGRFLPDASITRQDAAVMIARAANLKLQTDLNKSLTNLQKLFTDANGIDIYARTAVEAVANAKFIEGKENTLLQGQKKVTVRFDPLESFTRAEAAEVAMRVLRQQKKIPK